MASFEKRSVCDLLCTANVRSLPIRCEVQIFTDHKNLTYQAKDHNAKVTRWRLAVQDYDFDIVYIPGDDKFIADAPSRLCPRESTEVGKAKF